MTYAIVDIVWCKSHGIEVLPEMRTSVDQSKVILHEEMLLPFSDEDFPRKVKGDAVMPPYTGFGYNPVKKFIN